MNPMKERFFKEQELFPNIDFNQLYAEEFNYVIDYYWNIFSNSYKPDSKSIRIIANILNEQIDEMNNAYSSESNLFSKFRILMWTRKKIGEQYGMLMNEIEMSKGNFSKTKYDDWFGDESWNIVWEDHLNYIKEKDA